MWTAINNNFQINEGLTHFHLVRNFIVITTTAKIDGYLNNELNSDSVIVQLMSN